MTASRCLGQTIWFEAVWWLHGKLAGNLEQMGHQHVEDRAGRVIEVCSHCNVESLWYIDLHALNVRAVPGTGKEAVGEAQDVNVLRCLFSEKVINPIDLRFFERLMSNSVQLAEGL